MKKKFFFLPLLAALALTGCSSDEQLPVNPTPDEAGYSDNYMTVCVEMPTTPNGRSDDRFGDDPFSDGEAAESDVKNVVFFFFDSNDNCVDVQKIDRKEGEDLFKNPAVPSTNPYVTNYGTVEIRLKSNVDYKKVAVALNTSAETASALRDKVANTDDLEERGMDYITQIADDGSNQVMSNSVYFDMPNAETKPTNSKKVLFVSIDKDKHIYTSAQRATARDGGLPTGKEYVDIYVERVAAKVVVTPNINMSEYYIYQEGTGENATKVKTLTLFDHSNLTSDEIIIKPVIKGITLNVLTNDAKLIKSVNAESTNFYQSSATNYNAFQWNDPKNRRCYWGSETSEKMTYYSWNATTGENMSGLTQYIHPNTQASRPTADNENKKSLNTKVMAVAELHYEYAEGEKAGVDKGAIDLVRYGADYMLASSLQTFTANAANEAVRKIDWETVTLPKVAADEEDETRAITAEERKAIEVAVSKAFAKGLNDNQNELNGNQNGLNGNQFEIVQSNNTASGTSWEASIQKVSGFSYEINDLDEKLVAAAKTVIDSVIDQAVATVNVPTILYWKDGKTYFYTTIKQQGFVGLVGGGTDNYLNGVVRNHIYKVNLTGIYGLGTPVIDPGSPIDPERPDDERPSYLQAKISILPWRVVTNDATIH